MSVISVPVSAGELIDKITILEIKSARIRDPAKLANVRDELKMLETTWQAAAPEAATDIDEPRRALKQVNIILWDIEDAIRLKEKAHEFDSDFIELARAVYDFGTLYNAACTYAHIGDNERAFDLLERAISVGHGFREWIEHDSDLDSLRGLPRYREIMAHLENPGTLGRDSFGMTIYCS